jgi:hypothetical protein
MAFATPTPESIIRDAVGFSTAYHLGGMDPVAAAASATARAIELGATPLEVATATANNLGVNVRAVVFSAINIRAGLQPDDAVAAATLSLVATGLAMPGDAGLGAAGTGAAVGRAVTIVTPAPKRAGARPLGEPPKGRPKTAHDYTSEQFSLASVSKTIVGQVAKSDKIRAYTEKKISQGRWMDLFDPKNVLFDVTDSTMNGFESMTFALADLENKVRSDHQEVTTVTLEANLSRAPDTEELNLTRDKIPQNLWAKKTEDLINATFVTRLLNTKAVWTNEEEKLTYGQLLPFAYTTLMYLKAHIDAREEVNKTDEDYQGTKNGNWSMTRKNFINFFAAFLCFSIVNGPKNNRQSGRTLADQKKESNPLYVYVMLPILLMVKRTFPNDFNWESVKAIDCHAYIEAMKKKLRHKGLYSVVYMEKYASKAKTRSKPKWLQGVFNPFHRVVQLCTPVVANVRLNLLSKGNADTYERTKANMFHLNKREYQAYEHFRGVCVGALWLTGAPNYYASFLWTDEREEGKRFVQFSPPVSDNDELPHDVDRATSAAVVFQDDGSSDDGDESVLSGMD